MVRFEKVKMFRLKKIAINCFHLVMVRNAEKMIFIKALVRQGSRDGKTTSITKYIYLSKVSSVKLSFLWTESSSIWVSVLR